MHDKILFWVVLVWMVALLVMAILAVREVWKEDGGEPAEADAFEGDTRSKAIESAASDTAVPGPSTGPGKAADLE